MLKHLSRLYCHLTVLNQCLKAYLVLRSLYMMYTVSHTILTMVYFLHYVDHYFALLFRLVTGGRGPAVTRLTSNPGLVRSQPDQTFG